jgi:hypothetical protein
MTKRQPDAAAAPAQARHAGPLARRTIWLNQRKILKIGVGGGV